MPTSAIEHVLSGQSASHPDRVALDSDGHLVTYGELECMALGLATVLQAAGVPSDGRVLLLVPNSISFVAAFFGVAMSGAVVVCLAPDSPPRELRAMIELVEADAAVLVRSMRGRDYATELADVLPDEVVWIDDPATPSWTASDDRTVIVPRDPDAPALVAFTSGSTGRPKGAEHRAVTLVHAGERYLVDVLEGQPCTLVSTMPLYHLGGLTLILLPALLGGGRVVLMDGFSVEKLVDALENRGVDVLMAIPAMTELMFLRESVQTRNFKALRKVALGGSGVSNQLVRRCADELGVQVYVGYGLTECPGFCVISAACTPIADLGELVGAATKGYELAILDDDARPVPDGELGEVCLRSRFMMLGYFGNPEATAESVDEQGWLHTGDLGSLDPQGRLSIRGRKKEMYIRGGYNVYPREVEEALTGHGDVSLAAVISSPDAVLGEKGHAWVVPKEGVTLTDGQLREALGVRLAYYKLPDVIHFVDSLPVNAVGKIDKVALKRRLAVDAPMPRRASA